MSQQCIDPIVGKILAGWRYDISGLAPEMRGDYESHFADCEHCRSRQRMHRIIDVGLIALASVSGGVFLLAFGVIRHFGTAARVLVGDCGAGGLCLVGADLAGGGGGHTRPGYRAGCGQGRRAPGA